MKALTLTILFAAQTFEVASVHSSHAGPKGFAAMRMTIEPGGQRFTAANAPLRDLIMLAYQVTDGQVLGGPPWMSSEGFDIDAKAETSANPEKIRLLLQALLADRFGLLLRSEMKPLRVECLVVGKGPLRLNPTASPEAKPAIAIRSEGARGISITGTNATMPFIANWLAGRLHRIVADNTGLNGSFDFTADLAIDHGDASDPNVTERDAISHLFEGLPEKLGLRLPARTQPVETLTVEHADKPSEN